MNIISELNKSQTLLLLVSSEKSHKISLDFAKSLSKKKTLYITINKTYDSLKEELTKNKTNLNNVLFIDCISSTIKKSPKNSENCFYVSSPGALTEIALAITKLNSKQEYDYLVFDSVSGLEVYRKPDMISKFISSLINKLKSGKTKSVFFITGLNENNELANHLSSFVDKVVKVK
jgi:hypothetical protein